MSETQTAVPDVDVLKRENAAREAKEKLLAAVINEKLKLSAGALDRIGLVIFTVGFATPLITFLYGLAFKDAKELSEHDRSGK